LDGQFNQRFQLPRVEQSRDGVNWGEVKSVPATAGSGTTATTNISSLEFNAEVYFRVRA
jgi:hypothetical protein